MASLQNNNNAPTVAAAGGKSPAVFHLFSNGEKSIKPAPGLVNIGGKTVAPSTTVTHRDLHAHAAKEPMSPAVSVVSTHCGGSPIGGRIPSEYRHSVNRSASGMSHLDLSGTCSMTLMSTGGAHHHFEEVSESDEGDCHPFTAKPMNKKVISHKLPTIHQEPPILRAKVKGEAAPAVEPRGKLYNCPKTQKIIDEAHHFGLCEHYAKLIDQAKEVGFKNIKWPTNFTLFHLAAKKNNKEFIEWLVRNDFDDLHTIDDFGKKPIDYSCPKKRDSVYPMLEAMMLCLHAPLTAGEIKYQQVKAGTYVDPEKAAKAEAKAHAKKGVNCMAAILASAEIADGENGQSNKPTDMMSAFEAEQMVPMEYKKCFKKMANGGWQAMDGGWPNNNTTVLHWAARNGKEELCQFLVVEYGADVKQEDGNGHDAIYHAKLKRYRKLAKKLLLKFKEPKMSKGKKK